jgi:hypothetical protein
MIQNINDLQRIFLKYGPIPRFCIELAGDSDYEIRHERKIEAGLVALGTKTTRWLPNLENIQGIGYHLIGIQPSQRYDTGYPFPLTPYISGLIIRRAQAIDIGKAREIFDATLGLSVARTTAGHIFEALVLWRLRHGATIEIKPMDGFGPSALLKVDKTPSGIDPLHHYFALEQMKEFIEKNEGQLVVPLNSNFPSIDALLRRDKTIWLTQITLSKSHSVEVADLDEVLKDIPACYRPTAANKAKLVVITLSDGPNHYLDSANTVTTAKDIGAKGGEKWDARLDNYVAAIPKDWLFERV